MPVTPADVSQAILAAAPDLKGVNWARITLMIGSAVSAWVVIPTNVRVEGTTTGVAGSGFVTGKLFVPPNPIVLPASFTGQLLLGVEAARVALAIGVGVANAMSASALYAGASAGVGSGTDLSQIRFTNAATLTTTLAGVFAANGFAGVLIPRLSAAIGSGVATLLLAGTGVGGVVGPAGPSPAVGTSVSQVV